MGHVQKELYWLVIFVMFFIERDAITDVLFLILGQIAKIFFT
jgi:hypothetical protein|tara:strand:- start:1072 stop:1197 length:126 start_codon:yes stop_codon:yes gene_type:complete